MIFTCDRCGGPLDTAGRCDKCWNSPTTASATTFDLTKALDAQEAVFYERKGGGGSFVLMGISQGVAHLQRNEIIPVEWLDRDWNRLGSL